MPYVPLKAQGPPAQGSAPALQIFTICDEMEVDGATLLNTTTEVRRTNRVIRSTASSLDRKGKQRPDGRYEGTENSQDGTDNESPAENKEDSDSSIAIPLQRLLNVIMSIFSKDLVTDNRLSMSQVVKCDFTDLHLLGHGTSFVVRRLPELPPGSRAFGNISSSRTTMRTLTSDGKYKTPQGVTKQLRATRWRGQKQTSEKLMEDVITELTILNHHPISMHENVIDFLGILWEYDMDRQVWPVLVIEYADLGTLAAFQDQPFVLTFRQKMILSLDVGNGLDAIHKCGIIHGDVGVPKL